MTRIFVLLAILATHVIANAVELKTEIKYRIGAEYFHLLFVDTGQCFDIPKWAISDAEQEWTSAVMIANKTPSNCRDINWVVKENHASKDNTRPTKWIYEGELIDSGIRVKAGSKCLGKPIKVTSSGWWLEVGENDAGEILYSLCETL